MSHKQTIVLAAIIFLLSLGAADLCIADPPASAYGWSITGAVDYPMFKDMLSGMKLFFALFTSGLAAVIAFVGKLIISRIGAQRKEDVDKCARCAKWNREDHLFMFDVLESCLPDSCVSEARKRREAYIKRNRQQPCSAGECGEGVI